MKIFISIIVLVTSFILSGCATKINISGVKPAEASGVAKLKNISVLEFKNDTFNISGYVESSLGNSKINGVKYFNVIDRKNLNKILNEQKFQYTGLVDNKTSVKIGKISGVKALINATITKPTFSTKRYNGTFTVCNKNSKGKTICEQILKPCIEMRTDLSALFKIISTENGSILYSTKISKHHKSSGCGKDRYSQLGNKNSIVYELSNNIAKTFVSKLIPQTIYSRVTLLEEPDIDYSDYSEKLLENSIEYIKKNRLTKAKDLLYKVIDDTKEQSYVAFYNLGVILEAEGDLTKANEMYKKADSLTIEPIDEIDFALRRVKKTILNNSILSKQMSAKE